MPFPKLKLCGIDNSNYILKWKPSIHMQEKSPLNEFKKIWDSTLLSPEDKKKYSWDSNPLVVAYEFTVMDKQLTL